MSAVPDTSRRLGGSKPGNGIPKATRADAPPKVWPNWALKMRQGYEAEIAQLKQKNAELESAIVKSTNAQRHEENDRALSLYGTPGTLEEMTQMVARSPKYEKLTADDHLHVARVGLLTGLHPEFHLHAFKNKGKLVVTPDYKGLINLADRRYLMLKERRLTRDEMLERGIPKQDVEEGAIAYVVEGYELDKAILAKRGGIEYEPLRGFAWWPAMKDEERWDERQKKSVKTGKRIPNDVPNGRDGAWVAWKRAMRALFYQLADLRLKLGQPVPGAIIHDNDEWVFESLDQPDERAGKMVIDAAQPPVVPESSEQNAPVEPPASVATPVPGPAPEQDASGDAETDDGPVPAAWTRDQIVISKFHKWMASKGLTSQDEVAALGCLVEEFPGEKEEAIGEVDAYIAAQTADLPPAEPKKAAAEESAEVKKADEPAQKPADQPIGPEK